MKNIHLVSAASRMLLAFALIVGFMHAVEGAQSPPNVILLHNISVAVPPDITVGITTATGAKGSDDDDLANFLVGSHASDLFDPSPTFLGAQVNGAYVDNHYEFPIGITSVTFRWSDQLGNLGSANATVTVIDYLKKGDLLVGESVPVDYSSFGRIERIRNGVATPFCESPSSSFDPLFWDGPSDLIVDSKGQVVFLAGGVGSISLRLFRCTLPGEPPELIADFARNAVDAPPTADRPFPTYGFVDPTAGGGAHANGLHLAKRTLLSVNNDQNGGWPKISNDETYNFQAAFFEINTTGPQIKTFVYHMDSGQWDTDGPAGAVYRNEPSAMFFNAGTTYSVHENIIRAVVDPFQIDAGLKVGNVFSGKISLMLGGGAKQYDNLIMNNLNIPDVALPPNLCGGAEVPMQDGGFAPLAGQYGVTYDTWGNLGLVAISNYGPAVPFLTNIGEDMFKPNGAPPTFPQPYLNCFPTPEVTFSAPLQYYSPTTGHSNSVDHMASTSLGLVGTRFWGNDIVKVPAVGGDEVESVINNIPHPMGVAGFPEKIKGSYGVVIGISIQSPVNILLTDARGHSIGTDLSTGNPVNDFGVNGVDSGPATEPRYFFVRDPAPGAYAVQTVGTGDGPYTVDVYSADTTTGLSGRLTHTGAASIGSVGNHDFTLGAGATISFSKNAAPVPTNLAASSGNAQVALNWTAANGAVSYNVYQGTTINGESATVVKTGITDTHTIINGLTNGTTYYFMVAAVNASETSPYSNVANATPSAPSLLSAPTLNVASAGDGILTLGWTAPAAATSYNIYEGTTPGGESATPIKANLTGNTTTINGLTNGSTYYFTVVAFNATSTSPQSNEVSAAPASVAGSNPSTTGSSSSSGGGGGTVGIDIILGLGFLLVARRSRKV